MTPQERLALSRVGAARAQAQLDVGKETSQQLAGAIQHFKDEPEEVIVTFVGAFLRVVLLTQHPTVWDQVKAATLDTFAPGMPADWRARVLRRL